MCYRHMITRVLIDHSSGSPTQPALAKTTIPPSSWTKKKQNKTLDIQCLPYGLNYLSPLFHLRSPDSHPYTRCTRWCQFTLCFSSSSQIFIIHARKLCLSSLRAMLASSYVPGRGASTSSSPLEKLLT